ncbi:MAG TPA: CRISPR-associated helicase Cas3' [Aquabacterium sp.]|nr:CRISPR-associated helicase Cas3' [Aquabacterium sp.]
MTRAARAIWAKSGEPAGHGLLAHMLDVAAVAERLLLREPQALSLLVAQELGICVAHGHRALAALVGLHDIGKAIPGFQAKWPEGRAADEDAGLMFPSRLLSADQHDLVGVMLLRSLLQPWIGDASAAVAGAVAAHHGHFFDAKQIADARRPGEPSAWANARQEIFTFYAATLLGEAAPQASPSSAAEPSLPTLAWLAGLTSVADWIGSNTDWFPPGERAATFAEHHAQALRLADSALDAIGWQSHQVLLSKTAAADDLIAQIVGHADARARPLQRAADELLNATNSPVLLIVEAPMGEGKTELAFLAHLRLQTRLGHRGLYMALPTQATGNAMFDRTLAFLRAFSTGVPLDLQLAHGGALLDERLVELRGIHGEPGASVQSSAWFSQRKRPLLSPYGVGTIDQALFATLNVKHHFVRLWGLANRVVVLDEVHAYDTYTGGLIEALLAWLKALGCSVVLMSATLPRGKRSALLRSWGSQAVAVPELPYPRLLMAHGDQVQGLACTSRPQAPIALAALAEDLEGIAAMAARLLAKGGCGAVVVNTVDRAQQLYLALKAMVNEPAQVMLFHARFPADERSAHEQAVLAVFGKQAMRPSHALLVATQVVEQSLDIDFDFLISDLAPVDLLLQRAGRLHRHVRERPAAHQQARLAVAGLLPERLPELKQTAWGVIYDPFILCRTWAIVSRQDTWTLPQDIDRLVQAVYGEGDLPSDIDAAALAFIEQEAYGIHRAKLQTEAQFARNAAVNARAAPADAYVGKPGSEEGSGLGASNQTRLGDDTVTVLPVHVDADGWRLHPDSPPFDPTIKPGPGLARQMLTRQLRLGRKALVKALLGQDPPQGFQEHPWLRDVRPLCLLNGVLTLGKLQVQLDRELGIVYRKDDTRPPAQTPATASEPPA